MSLLAQVADYDNLSRAFKVCSRGKKRNQDYQVMLIDLGSELVAIRKQLLQGVYHWEDYRKFLVRDPKARIVSAPCFRDRVVHTAICAVIEPIIDAEISSSVYACRRTKGSRFAAIDLAVQLKKFGANRFVLKLDVLKYFDSIDHQTLLHLVFATLPDPSLQPLITDLVGSYSHPNHQDKGIPIGALTSQLFANFYLVGADKVILDHLGDQGFYFRYMDDFVLGATDPALVWDAAYAGLAHCEDQLQLSIPFYKRIPIGADPVPFLGFYIDHMGYRPLARNKRRLRKKIKRLDKKDARDSEKEQVLVSYQAWENLEPHLALRLARDHILV